MNDVYRLTLGSIEAENCSQGIEPGRCVCFLLRDGG
jgi:hypothetical protein